jgi:hypothetical protein
MEYTYEVVHCKTEEEWKIVQSIINYEFLSPYTKNECINFKAHMRAKLSYYQEYNSKILSFEEFISMQSNPIDDLSYLTEFLIKNEIT